MQKWIEVINALNQFGRGFIDINQVLLQPVVYYSVANTKSDSCIQCDLVLHHLDFKLDEDLKYKLHWHLAEQDNEVKVVDFVEYMAKQHVRLVCKPSFLSYDAILLLYVPLMH